ncbi:hypothetical protein QV09_05580 [Gallibacterium salpingitidis]|uniref:Cyanophage baseplate Pam3 plug gp18 domain-containing protein n=1 Tax=Gallibacterium salpingitidis TaxID=505341 RepID=A0AB36E5J9_9PAST|nr:hypothetical protein [Gallibacterium salpingitidis]OBX10418.1 hypothetical protein QV09_05580 [Gallibacterium salpingitidis]WKT00540.1 hypothetical protein NYR30_04430 [Gallibacterium salpingitidis]
MSIYQIPLASTPNQELTVNVGGQNIGITLNTRLNNELYISVTADDKQIINNRICRNKTKLINAEYQDINGELVFLDSQGNSDPNWKELNSRYLLYWVDKDEF